MNAHESFSHGVAPSLSTLANGPVPSLGGADFVGLEPHDLDFITRSVPEGAANIEAIYPLSPLQEGLLFHHLLNERDDTYVLSLLLELDSRARVQELVGALQSVIDRHDALRTAILWEELPRPVQVVYRHAALPVNELALVAGKDIIGQLRAIVAGHTEKWNLRQAPLVRLDVVADPSSTKWYAAVQLHHVICDYSSLTVVTGEIAVVLAGRADSLPPPKAYREHVEYLRAKALEDSGEAFFRQKLGDVDEPTAPFEVTSLDVNALVSEAYEVLPHSLSDRVRSLAQSLKLTPARLFHVAWTLVVAQTSGRDDIVFGTVLRARRASGTTPIGLSINTLPLRVQVANVKLEDLVDTVDRDLTQLVEHEHVPLVVAQRCSGITGSTPLLGSLFNFRHATRNPTKAWGTVSGFRLLAVPEARTNYPVAITVDDLGEEFAIAAQATNAVQPERMLSYLRTAIDALVGSFETGTSAAQALAIPILPTGEREALLREFNGTAAIGPAKMVHELFEDQARRTPDAYAVMHREKHLTYTELNARANQVARYLVNQGVTSGQPVGVCLDRSLEMVVALLGILKAGGAYLPLDPNYPPERLEHMLNDAAPRLVLAQRELVGALPTSQAEVVALDEMLKNISGNIAENLSAAELGVTPEDLVYTIYTSGSTGRPKGTAMPHRSMVNLIEWHRSTFDACERRRVLQFAALSFDVAFQETFTTLCTGGTLVLVNEWVRRDARALCDFLNDSAVDTLFLPPLMLQSLAESSRTTGVVPGKLRDVITAGEQLRISPEVREFFNRLGGCRLHNHYGPTETHVVTALTLTGATEEWPTLPSIGRPIVNARIYVLGTHQQLAPLGAIGEIYIGGVAVARGYLGRAELTAQRFVVDTFTKKSDARMYRTGDLGRWGADGTVEYLGRNDQQVKIRGYRVELGEVEAQLARHPKVREAAVVAREEPAAPKRLIAYVTSRSGNSPTVDELRAHLKGALPDFMLPSAIVLMESLPLSPNGKLDRRALPVPTAEAYASSAYEPPRGELEQLLSGIWRELLHVERIGRNDNFFELGGHSLLIVQMMERLRRVGLAVKLRSVYDSPTLAALASTLEAESVSQSVVPPNSIPVGCTAITPDMLPLVTLEPEQIERIVRSVPGGAENIQDIYPLAPLQEGILFHHLFSEHAQDAYLLGILLSVPSEAHLHRLVQSLQQVIDRHDVLRSAVLWEHLPRPVQVVYRHAVLPVKQLVLDPSRDPVTQVKEQVASSHERLNLAEAPLMWLEVSAKPAQGPSYALLRMHHLLCDHESLEAMLEEALLHLCGRTDALPPAEPYRNHVAQALAHAEKHDAAAYFRHKFQDITEPTAPFGILDVYGDGSRLTEAHAECEEELAKSVRSQARLLGVSAATLFHAAWSLTIACTSGRSDVVFGTLLLGRMHGNAGMRRILGMFINTLPVRIRLDGICARDLVIQTQRELTELLGYEQASLAVAQRCSGVEGSAPLSTALLNYRHTPKDALLNYRDSAPAAHSSLARAAGVQVLAIDDRTNYPVTLSIDDLGEGFALTVQSDNRIDARRVLGYVTRSLSSLVDALMSDARTEVSRLQVLPDDEREQLIEHFNPKPFQSAEMLIHAGFEQQVERRPTATAVTYEGQMLTYGELNAKSNQLAHYLRERGVGPDQLVGLCVERSLDMVVGILGILKAGGAYVPLDPAYPPERLAYTLEDAAPKVVLTQQRLRTRLSEIDAEVIALDADWDAIAQRPTENPNRASVKLTPQHLAYVIYTSGSTGKPKGVMVEHRNVAWLFAATQPLFGFHDRDVWTLFHSIAFDFSVWEMWGALLHGGRLVVAPQTIARSAHDFYRLLCAEEVTVLNQTPGAFAQVIEAQSQQPQGTHSLRVVICAGEALELRALRPWVQRNGAERPQLLNIYGITETTVFVTYRVLTAAEINSDGSSPIGTAIPGLRTYLLDAHRQPVPIGVLGEIFVGGAGVARGYLNRPELTAERFVTDPFTSDSTARMYKSGDLGRWRPDGSIEYLGRNDHQVKIRGFRIELGEIEAQLAKQETVKDAVVLARDDVLGDKRLVAYVVPRRPSSDTWSVEALRSALLGTLPVHMVPTAFVMLQALPLTENGKLDRKALPAPESGAHVTRQYEPPHGHLETLVADTWRDLLRLNRVGRHDNFFDLGGHSLLATRVISRVRDRLQLELPVRAIFDAPTVKQLADRIEIERSGHASREALWMSTLSQHLRGDIDEMQDSEVLAEIAELQRELGSSDTGHQGGP